MAQFMSFTWLSTRLRSMPISNKGTAMKETCDFQYRLIIPAFQVENAALDELL